MQLHAVIVPPPDVVHDALDAARELRDIAFSLIDAGYQVRAFQTHLRISSSIDGYDDAIAIANDTHYGLAASIWTSNVNVAHRAARDLQAGVVWVNCFDHGDMTQPFGGYKQSGQGRDKWLESLLGYTQTKSAWLHIG